MAEAALLAASMKRNREAATKEVIESESKLAAGWADLAVARAHGIESVMLKPLEDNLQRLADCSNEALDCQDEALQSQEVAKEILSKIGAAWSEGTTREWLQTALHDVRDFVSSDSFVKDVQQEIAAVWKTWKWESGAFSKALDGHQKNVTEETKLVKTQLNTEEMKLLRQQLAEGRGAVFVWPQGGFTGASGGADETAAPSLASFLTPPPTSTMTPSSAEADEPHLAPTKVPATLQTVTECETALYYSDNQQAWFPCTELGPTACNGVLVGVEKIFQGIKRTESRTIPQEKLKTHFRSSRACASCATVPYFNKGDSAMYLSDITLQLWIECIVIELHSDGGVRVSVEKMTEGKNHTVEHTIPRDRLATHLRKLTAQ